MDRITLSCGSGGKAMHQLIDTLFIKEFRNDVLSQKKDSAVLRMGGRKIAFTTDTYVVKPIFFPGGDIGSLAVYGTVNDLVVCGARPLYISLGLVIEEGFERKALERITRSIGKAAERAGVKIVTGDTKVVERGACDSIFINTSGIGEVYYEALDLRKVKIGDSVIVSGPIGDHAISVLSKREGLDFKTSVKSDSAPLSVLIGRILNVSRKVRFMRDPTRGGLATTLNEMVNGRSFGISIYEDRIPVREGVREACELIGFDPLYLACEGRVVIIAAREDASKIVNIMHRDGCGKMAKVIGEVSSTHRGKVYLNTSSGGKRIVPMFTGEQLPRIC